MLTPPKIAPITLTGQRIRLEPLSIGHAAALIAIGNDPRLWRLQPYRISTRWDMERYIHTALEQQTTGSGLPFVIIDALAERVIGSTRYMDICLAHRRLEIGATWLCSEYQRTYANTETKLLLLTHAFEALNIQRVIFKTETGNDISRRAILRLGATEEGIFRRHLIADDGRYRDMVYYSILDNEWPSIKTRLSTFLY
ncbi:MAG: GNAT family N-acetyltransferase [Myxococcales bacterium]|nr:GNAT family N-acetyltransferase [Myxococcales bacterium]